MIDVGKLKAAIGDGEAGEIVAADFTRAYLNEVVADIVAGREAREELDLIRASEGRVFGVKPDKRL